MNKPIEERINITKIDKTKYFNYYELTLEKTHLGEWMWTNKLENLIEFFDRYILRVSLLELANRRDMKGAIHLFTIDEICFELEHQDMNNRIHYQRIKDKRKKLFKRFGKFDDKKSLIEQIVSILNKFGIDVKVNLFNDYKNALDLVIEHKGNVDYRNHPLEVIFGEDNIC